MVSLAVMLVFAFGLLTQFATAASERVTSSGVLVVDCVFNNHLMDPQRENSSSANIALHAMYDTLVTFNGTDYTKVLPDIATSWTVSPAHSTTYRIELADDAASAISHTVVVRQRVTLNAAVRTLRRGMPLRLSGRVYPAHPGAVVNVQMLTGRGWLTVARPRLGSGSGFATTVVGCQHGP